MYTPSSIADGRVLCQSQRSGDTNGECPGNDDEEFLEARAANQGRHILTILTVCADGADSILTSVIPQPPCFLFLPRAGEKSIAAAREVGAKAAAHATRNQFEAEFDFLSPIF